MHHKGSVALQLMLCNIHTRCCWPQANSPKVTTPIAAEKYKSQDGCQMAIQRRHPSVKMAISASEGQCRRAIYDIIQTLQSAARPHVNGMNDDDDVRAITIIDAIIVGRQPLFSPHAAPYRTTRPGRAWNGALEIGFLLLVGTGAWDLFRTKAQTPELQQTWTTIAIQNQRWQTDWKDHHILLAKMWVHASCQQNHCLWMEETETKRFERSLS